ncbi:Hypothetical protein R9X50_00602200 [Acrodontium crateriforme]|uniref:Uncharacterized protein n=1 Tax=Acrodontium crateriforme TaxID=150365 RepID=A0AAQ3MAV8_9PEZI|nr:Hypothetical protein R9X50_00602200 [Acrodontium crateriforme]
MPLELHTSQHPISPANSNLQLLSCCPWMDGNGDQPCTGIQVHWPDYNAETNNYHNENPGYFCNSHPRLYFHTDHDPNSVSYFTKKRYASGETDHHLASSPRDTSAALSTRTGSSEQFSHKLVKSSLPDQTASYICTAPGAAGPSFVSYEERKFCHMPTKSIYPFCEDVKSTDCWEDATNQIVPRGAASALAIPTLNFTDVASWTKFALLK